MKVVATAVDGVVLIEPRHFADARGEFMETWHAARFAEAGVDAVFVQDNHSRSVGGVLRGLHYQSPRPQGKLVRVTSGAVFDVVVDLRRESPTYGRWFGCELSADNRQMLWAPPGMAHGFLALTATADVVYKCTDYYSPADERAIRWDDAELAIAWPLAPGEAPMLSPKDAAAPSFRYAMRFT